MPYDVDIQTWINDVEANSGTVSNKTAFSKFVEQLKADSLWSKYDRLWIRQKVGSEQAAITCLVTQNTCTVFGATWSSAGFTGDGVDDYIRSGFYGTGTNCVQNSAHLMVRFQAGAGIESANEGVGVRDGLGIYSDSSNFKHYEVFDSANTFADGSSSFIYDGTLIATRTDANTITLYKNGSQSNTDSVASITPLGGEVVSLAWNNNESGGGFGRTDYVSGVEEALSIGGGLTATEASDFTTALNTLFSDIDLAEYVLTTNISGDGTISLDNDRGTYLNGETVELTAVDGADTFSAWSGDVPSGQETANPLTVTMDQARTITATFESASIFENVSPADGATGVSVTPTLEINNPDNFTDLNYRVATSSNVDADVIRDIFKQADTAAIAEALSASTQYHWNAREYTPGGQTTAFVYQQDFESGTPLDDFSETTLTGTNSVSVVSGDLVVESNPDGRVGVLRNQSFGNVKILLKNVSFSDVSTDMQPTFHFGVQGTTWSNALIPSYYLYFLGGELRIGRVDEAFSASDYSSENTTYSRTAATDYDVEILKEEYRIRIAIWESSGSKSGYQFDYTDTANRYLSGGIAFKNAVVAGASAAQNFSIGAIEVIGAEFVDETASVDSVSVDPATASVEEGSTVTVQGTIQTSGGLSNAGTWTKQSGVAGITIQSTSGNNVVIAVDNTITDNDTAVFRLTADEDNTKFAETTVTAVEAVTGAYQDSEQGDRDALQALYDATDGVNWTNTWSTSTITSGDLSTLYGVTADTIGGEQRVTSIKLNGTTGINTTTWVGDDGVNGGNGLEGELPDALGNLKECKYFNVKQNALFGQLPQGVFEMSGAIRILLNGQREDYTLTSNINMNKTGSSQNSQRSNNFTGQLPASANVPNLDFLELAGQGKIDVNDGTGTGNLSGGLPDWLANTNLKGLILSFNQISSWNTSIQNLDLYQFYFHGNAMAGQGMPTWFSNFTNMRCMDIEGNALGGAVANLSTWTNVRFIWAQRNEFTSGLPIELLRGASAGIINMFEFGWNNFVQVGLGQIDRCPRLTAFTIDGSDFTGDIDASWGTQTPRLSNWSLGWNNFDTVPYDLTESTNRRYLRLRNNPNLQVASPETGLPLLNATLDNDGWGSGSSGGLQYQNCNFNGTITQEAIDAIVFNVQNNGLDYINISGNSFTSGELQPLIDALSGFSITFLYGNQTP